MGRSYRHRRVDECRVRLRFGRLHSELAGLLAAARTGTGGGREVQVPPRFPLSCRTLGTQRFLRPDVAVKAPCTDAEPR
jgi:hypothetical protein